jgi:hypothetical protein
VQLAAKGFHQQASIDYDEIFSLVVKPTTIQTVLSMAYSASWPLKQINIQNASLHDFLSKEVYMIQPPCFIRPSLSQRLHKLNNARYMLKHAPQS